MCIRDRHNAVQHIHGTYQEAALPELGEGEDIDESLSLIHIWRSSTTRK